MITSRGIAKDIAMSVKVDASQAVSAFGQVGKAAQGMGNAVNQSLTAFALAIATKKIGTALTEIGQKLLDLGMNSVHAAADFEHGMNLVRTQTDLTDSEFADLTKSTLALMGTIPQPVEEIQNSLYDVFSSTSVGYKDAISLVTQFSKAATAGNTSLETSGRAVIAMMNAYGLSASDATHLLDLQFQMVRYGVGTYEEFATQIGEILPPARAAGQSLETLAGAFAFATRQGLSTAEASTAVARAIDLLARPGVVAKMKDVLGVDVVDQATGAYRQINDVLTDMAAKLSGLSAPERAKVLAEIFGQGEIRANKFFKTAIPNINELNDLIGKMENSTGAAGDAFNKVAEDFNVRWAIVLNRIKQISIVIGQNLIPYVEKGVDVFEKLLDAWDKLSPSTQKLIAQALALAGVIALASGKVLTFTSALFNLYSLMKIAQISFATFTAVTGGLIVVIGLLAVAAFAVISNWKEVAPFFQSLWEDIKTAATNAFDAISDWWNENGDKITALVLDLAKAIGSFLVAAFKAVGAILPGILATLGTIVGILLPIVTTIIRFGTSILNVLLPPLRTLAPILPIIVGGLVALKVAIIALNAIKTFQFAYSMAAAGLQMAQGISIATAATTAAQGPLAGITSALGGATGALGAMTSGWLGLVAALGPAGAALAVIAGVMTVFGIAINQTKTTGIEWTEFMGDADGALLNAAEDTKSLTTLLLTQKGAYDDLIPLLKDTVIGTDTAALYQQHLAEATHAAAKAVKDQVAGLKSTPGGWNAYRQGVISTMLANHQYAEALEQVKIWQEKADDAVAASAEAFHNHRDAVNAYKDSIIAATGAAHGIVDAEDLIPGVVDDASAAFYEQSAAIQDTASTWDSYMDKHKKAQQVISQFVQGTGQDYDTFVSDAQAAATEGSEAWGKFVDQAIEDWQSFHDEITQSLDFLGPALDQFLGDEKVNLDKVDQALRDTSKDIAAFGTDFNTVADVGGEKAQAFLQYVAEQGPQAFQLLHSAAYAATHDPEMFDQFLGDFNKVEGAQQQLADKIVNTLVGALDTVVQKLNDIGAALLGVPGPDETSIPAIEAGFRSITTNAGLAAQATAGAHRELGELPSDGQTNMPSVRNGLSGISSNASGAAGNVSALSNALYSINGKTFSASIVVHQSIIQAAAKGFEGWVRKPTMFMVAEGGEPEYVSVTPQHKTGDKTGGGKNLDVGTFRSDVTAVGGGRPEMTKRDAYELHFHGPVWGWNGETVEKVIRDIDWWHRTQGWGDDSWR